MSIEVSLPGGGGGGVGSDVTVTNVVGVTFPATNSGGINPVGITGLVGITGFPVFSLTGIAGVTFPFPTVGITGFVGATIGNFPSVFGVTGQLGVSISNTGLGVTFPFYSVGVTGQLGVSISNPGLGVTFPVLSVTFPIGFGVTFNNGVTFAQQSAIGVTGAVSLTGLIQGTLGYTLGRTNIFKFSRATTGSSAFIFLATFMSSAGTNFYLQGYCFDGSYATATGGVGWLGDVGIQSVLSGTASTLMIHQVVNPGAGIMQVEINFPEPPFFGNSTIVAIGVVPSQTNLIRWTGSFWGFQR